ncbi:hypothetical protein [Breznakiella homolactica]|uniref:Uncharacterized protein n=1 Tax=Breznakiella homolactica TaxID=2798577 RepID=A0A7T7XPE2_9SPIR|nr:hypothetical protein [Breznakiella homolactica]QQO10094.1 hypothetical protein JFL75_04025 [Breznakiella homolactica]
MLRRWAIETINRKLKNGVSFDLMRRGMLAGGEESETLTKENEKDLYGAYL